MSSTEIDYRHPRAEAQAGAAPAQSPIALQDPEVAAAIQDEANRQLSTLEMIASENFASPAVLQAAGTLLTNKYAEGYPGRRYYGGCEHVDVVERIARERLKELYQAEAVNVQPHSGAQANMAVMLSVLKPGDTMLGMSLDHGGHLTHGHQLNFSGLTYNCLFYTVRREDERIDIDQVARLAREHKPKVIVCGGSAYPRFIEFDRFREIADEVGAKLWVDMAHFSGLVAGGAFPSPVPYADFVTSTTHKTLRGPRSGIILMKQEHAKIVNSRVFPGVQGGPLMHVVAAKAVAFGEALKPSFKAYIRQVVDNCRVLGEELVAAGLRLVSSGTDTHLVLVDVTPFGLGGKQAEAALEAAGITCNKNMIPYDPRPAMDPSGIRLGTPALTTRGMKEAEMKQIAAWISQALRKHDDAAELARIRHEVQELTAQYPLHNAEAFV